MNQNNNFFGRRLKGILSASGVERGELARYLGVSVPTVNRWLNGVSAPNAYQLRGIVHYFGMTYDWFLEKDGDIAHADEIAARLGLSPETVEILLGLVSEGGNNAVLESVDKAVCAVLHVIDGVYEDLDRYADDVILEMEEQE